MVADYFTVQKPVTKYGSERNQALRAKRSKPVTKATGYEGNFGSRNPDGSQYAPPPKKSKQVRPS